MVDIPPPHDPASVPPPRPGSYGPPPTGGGLPPRPAGRHQKSSRVLPVLLGVFAVLGFGAVAIVVLLMGLVGSELSPGRSMGSFRMGNEQIAMVKIEGLISPGFMFDFWMESLKQVGENEDIQGVILRINSPGGSVGSSQELYDEVLRLRNEEGKLVYTSMGDLAASGGYYIASASDKIFANRGSLTGSIGVIATFFGLEDMAEKIGASVRVIKTGRFKDSGSMFRPMNPDEELMFEVLLDDSYNQFLDDILAERTDQLEDSRKDFDRWDEFMFEKPEESEEAGAREFLMQIADGRVYSGRQAKDLGLIDELGSLRTVTDLMAEELGIPADEAEVFIPKRKVTLSEMLSSKVQMVIPSAISAPSLQYRLVTF